jgi:hypothetical protein
MAAADWPMARAESLPSGHISRCRAAFCAASSSTAPCPFSAAIMRS